MCQKPFRVEKESLRMRQGQHNNKRMRGRNRGKGPNPLTRSYESNGGDVKIRGTALHVAEKYVQLARDAQASGDRVAQENYLQHAEHYYRIVAAAQAQMPQPQPIYRNDEEGDDDEGMDRQDNRNIYGGQQRPPMQQGGGQPYPQHQPYQQQQPYQQPNEQPPYVNGGHNSVNGNGQEMQGEEGPGEYRQNEPRNEYRGEQRNDNYDNRGDRNFGGHRHRRRRPYRDNYGDRGEQRSGGGGGNPEPVDSAPEPRGDE
jgi:hypothetical protein